MSIGSSHVRVANGIVATTAHGQGCQPSQLRAHANGAPLDELGLIARHAAPRRRVMKTMPEKILFVDDDPSILSAFMRLLRHETLIRDYPSLTPFVVETAPGGRDALAAMRARGPHAVIVSDLRMPEMDGVQLLEEARTVSPSSVRILLTGQGDIETAIEAVNRGGLFRFLTKPCAPEVLVGALDAALTQYLLVTAERQLLDETLAGSVKVLTEVLSLVNPTAFSRALRIRRIVQHVSERLALADAWQLELASLLSQIGYLTLGIEPEEYRR